MQPEIQKLLNEVGRYLAKAGIAASTFGKLATKDARIIKRLQDGGQLYPSTAQRLRDYMKANPRIKKKKKTNGKTA